MMVMMIYELSANHLLCCYLLLEPVGNWLWIEQMMLTVESNNGRRKNVHSIVDASCVARRRGNMIIVVIPRHFTSLCQCGNEGQWYNTTQYAPDSLWNDDLYDNIAERKYDVKQPTRVYAWFVYNFKLPSTVLTSSIKMNDYYHFLDDQRSTNKCVKIFIS